MLAPRAPFDAIDPVCHGDRVMAKRSYTHENPQPMVPSIVRIACDALVPCAACVSELVTT
jgi:hypothetical protein